MEVGGEGCQLLLQFPPPLPGDPRLTQHWETLQPTLHLTLVVTKTLHVFTYSIWIDPISDEGNEGIVLGRFGEW